MPKFPPLWLKILNLVSIGKAAVGGAGVALALIGFVNVALALTALGPLRDISAGQLQVIAATGSLVAAFVQIASLRG